MDVKPIPVNRNLQEHELVADRMEISAFLQVFIIAVYYSNLVTLAYIEVLTSDALEPDAPNGFSPAMVARNILMFDVFLDVVGQLEELLPILDSHASRTEIIVRS